MGLERCLELLLTRRSIRRFRDEDVPEDLIFRILDIARFAPSAKNSQPWYFIVIRDKKTINKLSRIHRGAAPLERAPLAIAVACDPERSPDSYLVDCANATIYLMLAAHALGLGTVWIQTLRDVEEINSIVGIPRGMIPVAILAVGWPAESPTPRPRRPLREIAFEGRFGGKPLGIERVTSLN